MMIKISSFALLVALLALCAVSWFAVMFFISSNLSAVTHSIVSFTP